MTSLRLLWNTSGFRQEGSLPSSEHWAVDPRPDDLWANEDTYEAKVYILPKKLDEEVALLHLEKIGVKLTTPPDQATHLGVDVNGPYKPEHYRYY